MARFSPSTTQIQKLSQKNQYSIWPIVSLLCLAISNTEQYPVDYESPAFFKTISFLHTKKDKKEENTEAWESKLGRKQVCIHICCPEEK